MATSSRWRYHVWIGERGPYPDVQAAHADTARRWRERRAPITPPLLDRVVLALAIAVATVSWVAWALGA